MAKVLAISSHVVRGHVGLNATVPALQWLGHEVWALPTVLLASRPGLGRMVRHELPAPELARMLAGLEADGCWPSLDAVLTGYFVSPDAVAAAAQAIGRIKVANPRVVVLVDPILGDGGKLYVAQATAEASASRTAMVATRDANWQKAIASYAPTTTSVMSAAWVEGEPAAAVTQIAVTPRERACSKGSTTLRDVP